MTVTLHTATVEAIAQRVADLLRDDRLGGDHVDAAEVARRFSVSREFVYAHAADLGAIRLGDGPKARLRFDPAKVADELAARSHPVAVPDRAKPRRADTSGSSAQSDNGSRATGDRARTQPGADLLPIREQR